MVARPHPVDVHVGNRVRLRRTLLGMSQEKLGQLLGLTFQQIQKYERGSNRITSGKLFQIARALDVPVSFFFDELPEEDRSRTPPRSAPTDSPPDGVDADTMARRETLELVRAYYRIRDVKMRTQLARLMHTIAGPIPGAKRRGRPPKKTVPPTAAAAD